MDAADAVPRDGFALVGESLDSHQWQNISQTLATYQRHAVRQAERITAVRNLAEGTLAILAARLLGPGARPIRALVFDKTAEANWRVPWHQDLLIAVRQQHATPGFSAWSRKDGVPHAQPGEPWLSGRLALRLHLGDCDEQRGPLRVLPGTHRHGAMEAAVIAQVAQKGVPATITARAGQVLVMHPLLLHASSPAKLPGRQVLHVEYCAHDLPIGLQWAWGHPSANA